MQNHTVDQLSGQNIGNYRLEGRIGKGSLSTIYLAKHQFLPHKSLFTFYHLPDRFSADARKKFMARFRKEAYAIIGLRHPHILPVYEYGEYKDSPYLVTSYDIQGSLTTLMKHHGPCEHTFVLPILKQLVQGLACAHNEGFIHGMLQPALVLRRSEKVMQIAGFGLMHMLQRSGIEGDTRPFHHMLSIANTLLIAPEYVAPEIVEKQVPHARSDIYSLGCIVFELLSGHPPFHGGKPLDIARRHVTQSIPSLRQIQPTIPATLAAVVHRAIERDPIKRFADVAEFGDAFAQASAEVAQYQVSWMGGGISKEKNGEEGKMLEQEKNEKDASFPMSSSSKKVSADAPVTNKTRFTSRPNSLQPIPPVVKNSYTTGSSTPDQIQSPLYSNPAMKAPEPIEASDEWLLPDQMQNLPFYPYIEQDIAKIDDSGISINSNAGDRGPLPSLPTRIQATLQNISQQPRKVKRRKMVALLAAGGGALAASAIVAVNMSHFSMNDTPLSRMFAQVQASTGTASNRSSIDPSRQGSPDARKTSSVGKAGQINIKDASNETSISSLEQPANTAVKFTSFTDKQASILIHLEGLFVAYEQACTHEGIAIYYDPGKKLLICPAHGALFDPVNGQVIQGPAKQPLRPTRIRVNSSGTIFTF